MPATVGSQTAPDIAKCSLPGPILLLDELFDMEHPDVAAKCCPGIDSLIQKTGAVVIIATHKPHHWEPLEMRRIVALSSGRILAEEVLERGKSTTMLYK
jgi:ABC-type thiamine transport system ATPase subunit